ncbi:SDR family NAD(P)-dependent oxidoreductase [Paractinoplanes atraurantiacus]|uniref:Short-chain dehydrogenase n=1 Tax=Paractinoplanes atraurantiacus TaxID=1036182 RepID=A0A285KFI4_9ACTN|nr:SDR family NAD(P)-dependent oxidoreductase [Actinoplanes atraurantiacus]SNY70186.1 Short-chain dehydrogenase [Actinoplanes atraurantiacus]
MTRTIAVFGAGTGLGSSVARLFGRDGYRVALVARDRARLGTLAAELAAEGIEATAFAADLSRPDEIPALVKEIGPIDVVEYAPIATEGFIPAAELRADTVRRLLDLHLLSFIEVVHAVLPGMVERGDGAILLGQGVSATHPRPGMSGPGPAMAAARNYVLSLHAELKDQGVYAGVLHIGAMVTGSAGYRAMTGGQFDLGIDISGIPTVDPDDLAAAFRDLMTGRDRAELQVPETLAF